MPVGFGFSVGDFIAAIDLVGTVIDALQSSGNAGSEYCELVSQLLSLETTLLQVQKLEFEESQYQEVIALKQAAAQCQKTIDGFWDKARKYQPWLGNSSGNRGRHVKEGWMKIRWAVCKKEDVAKFKTDLMGHTQSISLLLAAVQRGTDNTNQQKQDARHESIVGKVHEGYLNCMQRINTLLEQGKDTFQVVTTILCINVRVFQVVLYMLYIFTKSLPRQIERQQPVYLIDALERDCPFHLEFIRCSEALLSVLKINFRKHGNGARKIDRKEFMIQDSGTKRDVSLEDDWDRCFYPGQRVNMSMIFWKDVDSRTLAPDHRLTCPRCQLLAEEHNHGEFIDCLRCGMTFQRELREEMIPDTSPELDDFDILDLQRSISRSLQAHHIAMISSQLEDLTTQHNPDLDNDDPTIFQRVRIIDKLVPLLYSFRPGTETEHVHSDQVDYTEYTNYRSYLQPQTYYQEHLQGTETDGHSELETSISEQSEHRHINQWLLRKLMSSPLEQMLFHGFAKQEVSTAGVLSNRWWLEAVLPMWYQDGTIPLEHSNYDDSDDGIPIDF